MTSDPVATVSLITLLNGIQLDQVSPVPMLKRAAIMCDRIYVDTLGMGAPGSGLERTAINGLFGGDAEGHDLFADRRFLELILRPVDFGDATAAKMRDALNAREAGPLYEGALAIVEAMPAEALAPVASPTRGLDYKARGALAGQLSEDLFRPEALRPWFPSAVGLITPIHSSVLAGLGRRATSEAFPDLIELAEAGVVDYGSLPWRDVLQLRSSAFIDEFRSRLRDLADGERTVMSALWADLWNFAAENKPAPMKTIITGILGNLPLPVVNPVSIADSALAAWKAIHQQGGYGWLYFILEAPDVRRHPDG